MQTDRARLAEVFVALGHEGEKQLQVHFQQWLCRQNGEERSEELQGPNKD